jgi:hypothetical protein
MKKIMFFTLLSITLSAHSQNLWKKIGDTPDKQISFFINYENMVRTGNVVGVIEKVEYKTPQYVGQHSPFLSLEAINKYDCDNKKVNLLQTSFYPQSGLKGTPLVINYPVSWGPVLPNTKNELYWKAACSK